MASQKKYEFHNMKMPEKFTENQRKIEERISDIDWLRFSQKGVT